MSGKPLAERLLAEAVALVAERGPGALSLREVQRRAGVSPAAAYRHFRDREALLVAVAQQCAGQLADHVAAALQAAEPPSGQESAARSRLFLACAAYIEFATGHPGLYRAVFVSGETLEDLSAPSMRARGSAGAGAYDQLVEALTDVVTATGGSVLHPWDPLAVWSCCHGLAMLRLDAALQFLSEEAFAGARDQVLLTITTAVPVEASAAVAAVPEGHGDPARRA